MGGSGHAESLSPLHQPELEAGLEIETEQISVDPSCAGEPAGTAWPTAGGASASLTPPVAPFAGGAEPAVEPVATELDDEKEEGDVTQEASLPDDAGLGFGGTGQVEGAVPPSGSFAAAHYWA